MQDILNSPLEKFINIQPKILKRLRALNLKTARDLLYHFPRRYEDYSNIKRIAELKEGEIATAQGVIKKIFGRHAWGRRMLIIEAELEDESGVISLLWFNQYHLLKTIRAGDRISVSGKVSKGKKSLYFQHPEYEKLLINDGAIVNELRHTGRLTPIYPETRGLSSRWLRYLMQEILAKLPTSLADALPEAIIAKENLPPLKNSLEKIHFPQSETEKTQAEKRFRLEELFILQLKKYLEISARKSKKAPCIQYDAPYKNTLISQLPFQLTGDQQKCLQAVLDDLAKNTPMNRLMDGDVGSGKTVVAIISAILCVKRGFQVLFMAPTEILAQQHFATVRALFENTGIGLTLLTSGKQQFISGIGNLSKKSEIIPLLQNGSAELIIGTHALLQKTYQYKRVGLIIIDEQHRFGVAQRAALMQKESGGLLPHLLSMTATPIPRTLALTIYGDLDISVIKEMPKDRKKIITKIVQPIRRPAAYEFIESEMKKGRQVFVICPRIENTESGIRNQETGNNKQILLDEIKTVKAEYEKLSQKIFTHRRVAMLHGKLKPKEKESIMGKFKNGDYEILVATSVVEVGVDVPNATVMMVESAEKFGLASLHQFRGRVGRSQHQSYCLLFPSSENHSWNKRLSAVAIAKDGFQLAEKDLKLRGPGNLVGFEQSGFYAPLQQALSDIELVEKTADYAEKIITEDPQLKKYPLLAERISKIQYTLHAE